MANEQWSADLLNSQDQDVGVFLGVKSGSISESIFKPVRGSATLAFDDFNEDIDWLNTRVRINHHVGEVKTPMGIWLPSISEWGWDFPRRSSTLELLDKTDVLNRESGKWFSVSTSVPIVNLVLSIVAGIGEESVSITDSDATLKTPLLFEPEITWLTIINDLLRAIGYSSLIADGEGTLVSDVYVPPEKRPVSATYGADGLRMKKKFTDEANVFDVPNVVYCVVPATDETPGLIGTARNDDPESPLSTINRGERPLTEQIEAINQEVADNTAIRRLAEVSQVTRRVTWSHPVDGTALDDSIMFSPLGETLALVQREITMGVGAVVTTTGRRIYTGGSTPW